MSPCHFAATCWCFSARYGLHRRNTRELEKIYGVPSNTARDDRPGMTVAIYSHAGITIFVSFINGISSAEYYRKEDGNKFTDHEIEVMLEANKQNSNWKQAQNTPGGRNWILADGSVQALYTEAQRRRRSAWLRAATLSSQTNTTRRKKATSSRTFEHKRSNQTLQPTAGRSEVSFSDNFDVRIRSEARSRQRWLSLFSFVRRLCSDCYKYTELGSRRGWESNPLIAVLQTTAFPLGYPATLDWRELYDDERSGIARDFCRAVGEFWLIARE